MQALALVFVVASYIAAGLFQFSSDEAFAVRFFTILGHLPEQGFSKSLAFMGWASCGVKHQWIFQKLAPFGLLLASSGFFCWVAERFLVREDAEGHPKLRPTWMLLSMGCLVYAQVYSFDYILSGIILAQVCAGLFLLGQMQDRKIFFWLGLVLSGALVFFRFPLGVALGLFFLWRISRGAWPEKVMVGLLFAAFLGAGLRVLTLAKLPILGDGASGANFWDYGEFLFRRYAWELVVIAGLVFLYRLIPVGWWNGWWPLAFSVYGLGVVGPWLSDSWLAEKFGWYTTKTVWFLFPLIASAFWRFWRTESGAGQKTVVAFFAVILAGGFVGTHARWVNYSLNYLWCLGFLAALLLPGRPEVRRGLPAAASMVAMSYFLYFLYYAGQSWANETYRPIVGHATGWVLAEAGNIRDAEQIAQWASEGVPGGGPIYLLTSAILPGTLVDLDFQVIPQGEIMTRVPTAAAGLFLGADTPAERDYYREYPAVSFQQIAQRNPGWDLGRVGRFSFLWKP